MAYKVLNIGRNGEQTQNLSDWTVSSNHAELSFMEGSDSRYRIRLLNLTNNIWLNGVSIVSQECHLTDEIGLGDKKTSLDVLSAINDLRRLNGLPIINGPKRKMDNPVPKQERKEVWSNIVAPKVKPQVKLASNGSNRYSGIIEGKPSIGNRAEQREPELVKKTVEKPVQESQSVTAAQIEKLKESYQTYKKFTDREDLTGILLKVANVIPMVAFILVRTVFQDKVSLGVMIIVFLLLQVAIAVLMVQKSRDSQILKTKYLAQLRSSYCCPLKPGKPLFYANSNVPIPFEELKEGINCQLCGQKCKRNNV